MKCHLRAFLGIYWRPYVIKKRCEKCGSTEKLNLHHIDNFNFLFNGEFPESKEGLTKEEVKAYEAKMLHIHFTKVETETLCERCHTKTHKKEGRPHKREQTSTPKNKRDQLLVKTCLSEIHRRKKEEIVSLRKKDLYESDIYNKEELLDFMKDKPDKAYVFASRIGGGNQHIDVRRCQQILKEYAPIVRG